MQCPHCQNSDAIKGVQELIEFFGLRVIVRCIVCIECEYLQLCQSQ